jgi:glycosyltransferase involved in cell wall biosynthesis
MRILQLVHGYPPRFNAGSEVYTQTVAQELAKSHDIEVFCRQEDFGLPTYAITRELDGDVQLPLINLPRFRDTYRHPEVEQLFDRELARFSPDVVHIQHLSHLSTSMVKVVASRNIPIVYTLHDFWLMCPRGQFLQTFPADRSDIYGLCQCQEDRTCAVRCYQRSFSGAEEDRARDEDYWTAWVGARMAHVRQMASMIDTFISPSRHLMKRFLDDFSLPESRLTYLDYGFDRTRLANRRREPEADLVFGYIGTHIPAKGVHHLIDAFASMHSPGCRLRIWGRDTVEHTKPLKLRCEALPPEVRSRIEWRGEYRNQDIVGDVFNHVDVVVVPSIWLENSPLVIHEAQQLRIPVVTADAGGMAEFVQHGVNGLHFKHRDVHSLRKVLDRLASQPEILAGLSTTGYLFSPSGDIPSIQDHVVKLHGIYAAVIDRRRNSSSIPSTSGVPC